MRPVAANMCKLTDLLDGTLDLENVALLNDILDVQQENERRYMAATGKGH